MKATTPITSAVIMAAGLLWYEIDDIQDLDIASSMFAQDLLRIFLIVQTFYGCQET